MNITPIIINVPHASTYIPEHERPYFDTDVIDRELLLMTDHYCDDLFASENEMITSPVSRLLCDMERFRDDEKEDMARIGMGAVYTRCQDGEPLREVGARHKERIIETYYDEYHKRLTEAVAHRLQIYDRCLIIDGHSFYSTPLPYEREQNPDRADICIGTDDYHTPVCVAEFITGYFRKLGYTVAVNTPFSGSIVPIQYYRKDKRVQSVMIELNRRIYLNGIEKNSGYQRIKEELCSLQSILTERMYHYDIMG